MPDDQAGGIPGSCLCGAVRFRIDGAFDAFFLCHCSRCRKDTGSAHGANLFSQAGKITWLAGGDKVWTYRVPGTRHEHSFCPECGSSLPRDGDGGLPLVVPAGSLDAPPGIEPTAHICLADRAEWDDALADAPRLDDLP